MRTREQRLEYGNKYYFLNKDKISAQNKILYKKNKDLFLSRIKKYKLQNPETVRKHHHKYYLKNREKCLNYSKKYNLEHKEDRKKWELANREHLNEKYRKWYFKKRKSDINFRIARAIRNRLFQSVKNLQKAGSAVRDLGCSIPELKEYMENKFLVGMSWDNWGYYGWHIDHIIPVSSFDLQNREQFLKAVHYTNLQPMWAKDNLLKKDKMV